MADRQDKKGGIGEALSTIIQAILIALAFQLVLFQPFWIPSGSMKSTLLIGDFLFVNKMAYGYSWASCPSPGGANLCWFAKDWEGRLFDDTPERGDVVVFKHPVSGQEYIKRLIGLPGDRVQLREGRVYINDEEARQEPIEDFVEIYEDQGAMKKRPACINTVGFGADCIKKQARETLPGGASHLVLNVLDSGADNTGIYEVPADHYFFLGDNRDNSVDSRFDRLRGGVGFVPKEYLVGRADRVWFSSAGSSMLAFWTWRRDRFFKAIE